MKKSNKKEAVKVRKKANKKQVKKKLRKKRRPENASLIAKYISKIKQEYLDYDYISQLSEKEKKWLADFTAEYLNAEVPSQKDAKQTRFHKSKKLVKTCTDRNNAMNRDISSQMRAQGRLMYLSNENMSETFSKKMDNLNNDQEDAVIDLIDKKREGFNPDED